MSLDDAIQINPSSSDAYHQKCLTLVLMGQLEGALENIEIAIQNQPENSQLFNNRAFILHCLGHYSEAIFNLEHAIILSPEISILYENKQYLESQQCTPDGKQQVLENLQQLIKISDQQIQDQFLIQKQLSIELFDLSCFQLGFKSFGYDFIHEGNK
ncbi:unnamed protein product [Paramecium sonneborni]|uniref:Tetratricopeptide repeat protein n=1 Tax=Paramecium sonneborni TaxID=65129 RepID=A0A8S1QTP4_9CILI|nr:unnamed protein product [Paramecium sonneborni]